MLRVTLVCLAILVGFGEAQFNITVLLVQNDLPSQETAILEAFSQAAIRWGEIISTDFPDVGPLQNPVSIFDQCQVTMPIPAGTFIPDMLITANVSDIDGTGRILGSARPCLFVEVNGRVLVRAGVMNFDSADTEDLINQGSFENVILHEMGHVLGIGSLWAFNSLVQGSANGPTTDPRYVGENAVDAFQNGLQGSDDDIAVANTGGTGTQGSHWRESSFENELMTGFLSGGSQPISIMTIQSLVDLGYTVNDGVADAFVIPGLPPANPPTTDEDWEDVGSPDMDGDLPGMDPDGNISPTPSPAPTLSASTISLLWGFIALHIAK